MVSFDQVRYLDCDYDLAKRRAAQNARAKKQSIIMLRYPYNQTRPTQESSLGSTKPFPTAFSARHTTSLSSNSSCPTSVRSRLNRLGIRFAIEQVLADVLNDAIGQ